VSGVLKTIGKVFISPISMILPKKIGKIVRKVALGAMMVGAVVLTGGAAIGALPALGSAGMLGSLGLSAGLTSALAGAVSTGAVGAVVGGLTGGFKGATKGFLMGAATGGIMGGLGMMGPNGLLGGGKVAASSAGSALGKVSLPPAFSPELGGMSSTIGSGATAALKSAAPIAESVTRSALPSIAGLGGGLTQNPQLLSQLLGGVASAFAPNEAKQSAQAQLDAAQSAAFFTWGGGDPDGKKKKYGFIPGVYSGQANPFGTSNYAAPPTRFAAANYYQSPRQLIEWDPATSSIVQRMA
jgi:hypothetical protein